MKGSFGETPRAGSQAPADESVAAEGVKAIVGSDPDRAGAGQRTVVSEEKKWRRKLERDEWARIGCDSFRQGRNLPVRIATGRSRAQSKYIRNRLAQSTLFVNIDFGYHSNGVVRRWKDYRL